MFTTADSIASGSPLASKFPDPLSTEYKASAGQVPPTTAESIPSGSPLASKLLDPLSAEYKAPPGHDPTASTSLPNQSIHSSGAPNQPSPPLHRSSDKTAEQISDDQCTSPSHAASTDESVSKSNNRHTDQDNRGTDVGGPKMKSQDIAEAPVTKGIIVLYLTLVKNSR